MVEGEGFEPSAPYGTPAFQASKLNHSDILPNKEVILRQYQLKTAYLKNLLNFVGVDTFWLKSTEKSAIFALKRPLLSLFYVDLKKNQCHFDYF